MKARPRSIERKVAAYLSEIFSQKGLKPIERIPVLGRRGPDLTINELCLVIDVKSRLEVPKGILTVIGIPDEWRYSAFKQGISELILHRPKMPTGSSTLIIHKKDRKEFIKRWITQLQSYNLPQIVRCQLP